MVKNELKETGHTPELTGEHDGKEVPVKRQTAANRKPPLQKSRSQDTDRQTESSLSCSPVEANRRVHAIHSQLKPQATPPPSVIGPTFSDIQREFQRKMDASAGGLLEAELQQHEVMTEDSLSNDEYDCASPDDISLPPLAETPESYWVQSDVEEGFCFSSHSIHINQYSQQSEHSGSGAARQQRESSLTESCPTPPPNYSSTRFRSESSSFVQSPLTVPPPGLLTSTLSNILITGKTSTANISQRADLSLGATEPKVPSESNQVHKRNTPDNCVPDKRSLSPTDPLLKEHKSLNNHHQRSPGTLVKITKNVASKDETMPQTEPISMVAELNPRTTSQLFQANGSDHDLHNDKTPPQDQRFLKCSTICPLNRTSICQNNPQSSSDSKKDLHLDINFSKTKKETSLVSKPQRGGLTNTSTSTITQQNTDFQSSPSDILHTLAQASSSISSHQSETLPKIDPVQQAGGFAQSPNLKDRIQDTGLLRSCATCLQTTTALPQEGNISQPYPASRRGLNQDVPFFQISKETPSVSISQSSNLTTTVKQTVTQASSSLSSPQESLLSQSETLSQIDPFALAKGFAQSPGLKNKTSGTGDLKSCSTCLQTATTLPQDGHLSQSNQGSTRGLDRDVLSFLTSKVTSSFSIPQSSSQTTATTVKQTKHCQSTSPDTHHTLAQASDSPQESWLSQSESLPKINLVTQDRGFAQSPGLKDSIRDTWPLPPEPNDISNISLSSSTITKSNRVSSKQNHQTVYSLHESLISTCTQQCVHDPGMTLGSPAKPTPPPPPPPPPHPKPQTQALAQQANPHVTPFSSPHHLLTPEQDPNICQPMAICEEIRLTPQIQGPPLPAPHPAPLPQAQAESLPQGKASKPDPPCFTRPLSRATVMEGSPVTLEVEVTGHPEPTLTWCKDGEVSAPPGPGRAAPPPQDGTRSLFIPEDSTGDPWLLAEDCDIIGVDWLAEDCDIIGVDWLTWFGTLCVLLWLLYLILL
ncbi:formin-like protein 7 [Perca flavescens]|uniref:formin-like protein 7 n=1 Tax=Perca flavescens TaxID=8167 RepID=UPI00106EADDC|nr:formin-like protein 7 [Perca flavescens]